MRALPKPGDPYVMDNGRLIKDVEREAERELSAKNFKAATKRTLKEMPAPPETLKAIAVILVYTLLGVGNREISEAVGITTDDVKAIRKHAAYGEAFDYISQEFISVNSNLISARIAAYGHDALSRVYHHAMKSKHDNVSLRASRDILDRGGHGARSLMEKAMMGKNELRIVLVEGSKPVDIEVNGEKFG
jgi:hypothetical protein